MCIRDRRARIPHLMHSDPPWRGLTRKGYIEGTNTGHKQTMQRGAWTSHLVTLLMHLYRILLVSLGAA
eukprot:762783-Pyramimonas_sp.AAC.1